MTMDDRDGLIWLDGEMVPWREAKVHVLTHTLHYGMGVFEGVRAYETATGPAIFRLEDRLHYTFHHRRELVKIARQDHPHTAEWFAHAAI